MKIVSQKEWEIKNLRALISDPACDILWKNDAEAAEMIRGIAIMGLNGAGKSTLAHALAKRCGFFEMDAEDYYFPQQREGRRRALENCAGGNDEGLPFADARTGEEAEAAILHDVRLHERFVLSGVTMNWCGEILSRIDLAFVIRTPQQERLKRIQDREIRRFGSRVLEGGDMFEQQAKFREMAKSRDFRVVEESAAKLGCPVILLDGTRKVEENLRTVMENLAE